MEKLKLIYLTFAYFCNKRYYSLVLRNIIVCSIIFYVSGPIVGCWYFLVLVFVETLADQLFELGIIKRRKKD